MAIDLLFIHILTLHVKNNAAANFNFRNISVKKLTTLLTPCFVACVTALPAFANPIWGWGGGPSHGAPAPLLAAGIPAFIAIGVGALAMKLFRNRDRTAG